MVARVRPRPDALVVTFERDGEPPIRIEVPDGRQAVVKALAMLFTCHKLQVGDRLTVTAAE